MQTTKHTPAPWQAYNASNGRILKTWSVCDKRGCRIAKIEEMPGQSGEEEMANARLIAAAPDMLAALQAALACLENLREVQRWDKTEGDHIDEAIDARDAVHLAIRKATA